MSIERCVTEQVIFMKYGALQFRCKQCDARVTWSRFRTGGYSDCLIGRRNCQDVMMAASCPHCGQLYAKRLEHAQCVPDEQLERAK